MAHLLNDLRDPGGAIVLVAETRERYWSLSRWCAGGRVYWEQFFLFFFIYLYVLPVTSCSA